ncbi:hypothetical protein DID74_01730 [Candidatus Marinamargulisbacteria bacterium SCGC AG-333-B06]|nr:hypothetical protein DID74_01730 [Candidatus Marinamargulisbacteria bacterium SCGC AG-333-B06]
MKKVNVKNTYKLKIAGAPKEEVVEQIQSEEYGVAPARIKYIKPKVVVKIGDKVNIGSRLFFDKKNEINEFLSPVSGMVKEIKYGEKRVVNAIIITANNDNQKEKICDPLSINNIKETAVDDIKSIIQRGGLWSSFIEYPFNRAPQKDEVPPSIYVSLDNDEPFLPESHMFIKGHESAFLTGLSVIKKICKKTYLGMSINCKISEPKIRKEATHQLIGNYPANDPGVLLYYNKTSSSENNSWGIRAQDVIRIGMLFETGVYPTMRLITVAGSLLTKPSYAWVHDGMPIKTILKEIDDFSRIRVVAGGALTGQKVTEDDYINYRDFALQVLPEGREQEFLHFFKPGFHRPTVSRTYMSALLKDKEWDMNTSLNGGHRACISCGSCVAVCPVETYPQVTMKNLNVNDIETAMAQGVLDCVECGLCTYVCPSKIELDDIVINAKNIIAKEVGKA